MRIAIALFCLLLCGCRVDMLQLLGATIYPDDESALRGPSPADMSEAFDNTFPPEETIAARYVPNVFETQSSCSDIEPEGMCDSVDGECPEGFRTHPEVAMACLELNECLTNNGGCDARTTCTNIVGSRTCGSCPPGFMGDGENGCEDISECMLDLHNCEETELCINTVGSFVCVPG